MHKAYRVDVVVDIEGRKVVGLGTESYFCKDSLSTVGSKVKYEVAEHSMESKMDENSMVDTRKNHVC